MNITVALIALAFSTSLTTLTVEGIKKLLDAKQIKYESNLLAAIVAVALSIIAALMYILYYSIPFNAQTLVLTICFAFFTWLGSMVGFDKIKQLLQQLAQRKEG